ncbi:MAG: Asp-tRNA(Asn)/Glu-tRNA(Gln) amidotransferase subunit GatA [Flavobacteriales bacterium TMED288]|nr:Asp-tRNA(Asn)/Glu-tRNA(Gln) amidotransferase GatCAB subunit A [Flavobacteriales bacterium]RPG53018.1 MAG: Asp-tRNA(Asn)/Glu-tRNA(Gln) amidotransferase subunit GatA [Flavobacteriales bacterium TMED288]
MKNFNSLIEIQALIFENKITCETLIDYYLKRINKTKNLNVFIEVFSKEAKIRAKEIDKKIKRGSSGKLAGLVVAIKDNICFKNHKLSAGSKILNGFTSLFNATAVERLLNEDAIIIGRVNCDEFAMGSSNENSIYGPSKNPHNLKKVPGGSSGGSAAAVAADLCQIALGSDTGGSVRQPASFCGVFGLKPTYARISRYGLIAYASSFDQIGPIGKSVYDISIVTEIISGKDNMDSTSSSLKIDKYSTYKPQRKKLKIAFFEDYLNNLSLNTEIKSNFFELISKLKKDGHTVSSEIFPYSDIIVPCYYILTTAEASSNLSRYDGVNYGYRSSSSKDINSTFKNSRTEGFGEEVKRRIMLGTFVLSSGYYDAYYGKAQKIRRLIQNKTNEIFKNYDYLLMPTTPNTAFDIGIKHDDPTINFLQDIYTVHSNLTGHPAISIPIWKSKDNMPMGLQIMTSNFNEKNLFSFSEFLMKFKH